MKDVPGAATSQGDPYALRISRCDRNAGYRSIWQADIDRSPRGSRPCECILCHLEGAIRTAHIDHLVVRRGDRNRRDHLCSKLSGNLCPTRAEVPALIDVIRPVIPELVLRIEGHWRSPPVRLAQIDPVLRGLPACACPAAIGAPCEGRASAFARRKSVVGILRVERRLPAVSAIESV